MDEVTQDLVEVTMLEYNIECPLYRDAMILGKWEVGKNLPVHTDNQDLPGQEDISTPWREYTGLVYLNDSYEGGKLTLPEVGLNIQPTKGMAIIIEASEPHGVTRIEAGTRYTAVTWMTRKEEYGEGFRASINECYRRLDESINN